MTEKIKLWRKRLLDTGKRNKLLNFTETKRSTLKITYPNIDALYSLVVSGKNLRFSVEEDINQDKLFTDELVNVKEKDSILTTKSGNELNKSLYTLKTRSKSALEELGINILYLGFGFLEWTEIDYSKNTFQSPILLVPVEIQRESILTPYSLSLFEDEIIINPTLCYKLESDFGIKIDFDFDPDNLRLDDLFIYISEKICSQNWKVNKEVQLSLFSFLKLNMYKDLENNEPRIVENNIIRALCGQSNEIPSIPKEIADANDLDKIINPLETFQVVDADSSQQQAIIAAKKGISFVLQGPPGTGKSQTITNIISECLAMGKKILFVSEKMAALEVVYRNLQNVELEDFCLQLHSHKANKISIVKELADTLKKQKTQENGNHVEELEILGNEINLLNDYANQLHKKQQPLEKSVFQIHGEIEKLSSCADIQVKLENVSETTKQQLNNLVNIIRSYSICVDKVGLKYRQGCFFGLNKSKMTFELKNDYKYHLSQIVHLLTITTEIIDEAKTIFHLQDYESIDAIPRIISLLELVILSPHCPSKWLLQKGISNVYFKLKNVFDCYQKIIEKENEIFGIFKKDILDLDVDLLLQNFTLNYSSILRIFNSTYRNDKKLIDYYKINPKLRLEYSEVIKYLRIINEVHDLTISIQNDECILFDWLGNLYVGRSTDWKSTLKSLDWIIEIEELYGLDNISEEFAKAICSIESPKLANNLLVELRNIQGDLSEELSYISNFYDTSIFNIFSENIKNIIKKFSRSINEIDSLFDWVDFIKSRNDCINANLQEFLDEVETKEIPANQFCDVFLKRFYSLWVDNIYNQINILNEFQREKFERIINDFQNKDINQLSIAKVRIRQSLSAQRPDLAGFIPKGTEISILLRESEKRRKILPIRKLFEKIPNLLLTIKPCLLMSPLSVSQYLNPELFEFDVVIFDEASQVLTENAIGAIYRGKQLIVVGDREQLPPTNFFNASISDEDDDNDNEENDIGAYESILDECGSILNRLQLLWHYRSRDENLIAFSNAKIYKNLITFPTLSGNEKDHGVEFIHVMNGIYDRSQSKTNRIEAKKVAELVFSHFEKFPQRSLGIVTFSEAQQLAIDNEIMLMRENRPQYESFFLESNKEHFFVKNLENVQGDERDTIILSVGYGKDKNGKLSMFFGPLNHEGGYRRLNVAITRAKINVKLVSSLLPNDIDLSRTESIGIKMLKSYMDFSIRGVEAILGELSVPDELRFDSPFEKQVFDVLIENGYEVDTQVGCSGYRIDLAVKHPYIKNTYLIAIECDGATYHSAKTARERDRLRGDILRDRGWKIYRIWSTDWIHHRASEIERLLQVINQTIEDLQQNKSLPGKKILKDQLNNLSKKYLRRGMVLRFPFTSKPIFGQ